MKLHGTTAEEIGDELAAFLKERELRKRQAIERLAARRYGLVRSVSHIAIRYARPLQLDYVKDAAASVGVGVASALEGFPAYRINH